MHAKRYATVTSSREAYDYAVAANQHFCVQSRFIAVAGFGNLPGDVAFHERTDKGSFQQLGSTRCVAARGSPLQTISAQSIAV